MSAEIDSKVLLLSVEIRQLLLADGSGLVLGDLLRVVLDIRVEARALRNELFDLDDEVLDTGLRVQDGLERGERLRGVLLLSTESRQLLPAEGSSLVERRLVLGDLILVVLDSLCPIRRFAWPVAFSAGPAP